MRRDHGPPRGQVVLPRVYQEVRIVGVLEGTMCHTSQCFAVTSEILCNVVITNIQCFTQACEFDYFSLIDNKGCAKKTRDLKSAETL